MAEIFNERLELGGEKEVELSDSLVHVYQMVILLNEIKRLYPLLASSRSAFYPFLLPVKEDLPAVFREVFEEGKGPELEQQSLANHKISQFLNRKFCVSRAVNPG